MKLDKLLPPDDGKTIERGFGSIPVIVALVCLIMIIIEHPIIVPYAIGFLIAGAIVIYIGAWLIWGIGHFVGKVLDK